MSATVMVLSNDFLFGSLEVKVIVYIPSFDVSNSLYLILKLWKEKVLALIFFLMV